MTGEGDDSERSYSSFPRILPREFGYFVMIESKDSLNSLKGFDGVEERNESNLRSIFISVFSLSK